MADKDVRWIQRFHNYRKALKRLSDAVSLAHERELSDLEQQGLIQAFEFTFDMASKTMQDFVVEKGYKGERDKPIKIFIEAAALNIISEQEWRDIYKSRNKTSHTYDEDIAENVFRNILETHYAMFIQLETRLQLEKISEEKNLFNQDDTE